MMALTKPVLYNMAAFDATKAQTFTFNVIGGDQVVKSKLTITNQATGVVVYDPAVSTLPTNYSYYYVLPANTLANYSSTAQTGYYTATITTYNAAGTASTASNAIQFYCYTAPTFSFTNIPSGGVITNASYEFQATYNQAESEPLNSYTMTLYNSAKVQLSTSGEQYVDTTTVPYVCGYTFSGLEDNTTYYITATGQTSEGTKLSIDYTLITVQYSQPSAFTVVELSNNCTSGYILAKSNMVAIDGVSYPSPPTYVDNTTSIDLSSTGSYVSWIDGYDISSDFTASLWGRDFNSNSTIVTMTDSDNNKLTVIYRVNPDGTGVYADLSVVNDGYKYYIYSPTITTPASGNSMQIWFRRIGNLYEIYLHNLSVASPAIAGIAVAGIAITGLTG